MNLTLDHFQLFSPLNVLNDLWSEPQTIRFQYVINSSLALRIYLLLLCLIGFGMTTKSQSSIDHQSIAQINHYDSLYELSSFAGVYTDTSGSQSLAAIQNANFSPLDEFAPTLDANFYWVKLIIKSNIDYPTDWRLFLFKDWCEGVEIYSTSKQDTAEWIFQKAGFLCPLSELDQNKEIGNTTRKVPNAISVSMQAGEEKTFFIRYRRQNRKHLHITPELVSMVIAANQIIDYNRTAFLIILFMSMLCILALYHLLVYFMTKDLAYFYYALYGFYGVFAATVMDEYGWLNYHLFYSNHPGLQPWVFNNIGIAVVIAYILFTRSFLETKKRFPKLDIAIKALLAWAIFMITTFNINYILTDRTYIPGLSFAFFVILVVAVFVILLISTWRNKKGTDIFYFIGLGVTLLVIVPVYILLLFNGADPEIYLSLFSPLHPVQVGLIMELLVFALGLGYRTRQIAHEKQRLEELDHIKSRFFANISHEFRTPLTLVLGPLKQMMEKSQIDPSDKNLLQMAHRNASRLLHLINQLLDLSKLKNSKMELQLVDLDFAALLKGIVMSFESLAVRKNIRLHFVSRKEEIRLAVDRDMIEKIFYNLLSNAFKFTKEQGEISILLNDQKNGIEIIIRDNGIGIAPEHVEHIFNRFYMTDASETRAHEGTGIGLALVKELVDLHAGKIYISSKEGKGTTFTIELPKVAESIASKEKIKNTESNYVEKSLLIDSDLALGIGDSAKNTRIIPGITSSDLPVVLIIEDNIDVRNYIKQYLISSFQIYEAINGEEGIEKAFEYLPDLIISDVMMPKKSGYEVCKILKTDQRTSHIPLILLTAKAAQDEKMKGLETGADDYLVKPFDTKELEVRVRNLIELRLQLRKRFSEDNMTGAQALGTNSVDKAFLKNVLATIDAQLSNEQFGVEVLASEIGMSKGHLNRKLKALTDQTANKLIQSYRLQKAMELLKQKSGNVSEIAFQTGFSSTSYFVKCFGDKYGTTPGAVLQEL